MGLTLSVCVSVAQVELLQSQGEVVRLLDRVGETTRDRSEMVRKTCGNRNTSLLALSPPCPSCQVSHKVHSQLLQIADERALASEQKARELEREVCCATQH